MPKSPEAPQADETFLEGDEVQLEAFEKPVPVVKAEGPVPNGVVKVRVLPKGDGKVATGHFDRQINAFTFHKRGDHLFLHPSVAKTQEDAGLVEIVSGG